MSLPVTYFNADLRYIFKVLNYSIFVISKSIRTGYESKRIRKIVPRLYSQRRTNSAGRNSTDSINFFSNFIASKDLKTEWHFSKTINVINKCSQQQLYTINGLTRKLTNDIMLLIKIKEIKQG